MTQNDLVDWYEANLSIKERKSRGHFSTPSSLVQHILDACGYTPERELAPLRVLDPACGSGNFVAGAARRLIAYGRRAGLSRAAIARLIERNIWGFDPDPVACFLAEMQLHHAFVEQDISGEEAVCTAETSRHGYDRPGHDNGTIKYVQIHQADGLAFPWPRTWQVDLLLANPPYLAAKNNDLSVYRSARQRGQADSYLLFLELALQVVRPGGWLGLVLPDPVLARSNAARERKQLLAEMTVHHIWHLADVFAASVGAVVIVAQKQPPPSMHFINWRRERWTERSHAQTSAPPANGQHALEQHVSTVSTVSTKSTGSVSQALLHRQEGAELRYLLTTPEGTLAERISTHVQSVQAAGQSHNTRTLIQLGELVYIHRGEEISKESARLTKQQANIENGDRACTGLYPVLRGGSDVRPYGIPHAQYSIAREQILKPLERYLAPKLLVVKSTGRLQASLDLHGHVVLQTLYTLSINPQSAHVQTNEEGHMISQHNTAPSFSLEHELYYLLALLNSQLLQTYVYILHTAYKWVQPQIEQWVLTQLPLPAHPAPDAKRQIIQRAQHIMNACSEAFSGVELEEKKQAYYQVYYEEQERAICQLYQAAIQEREHIAVF